MHCIRYTQKIYKLLTLLLLVCCYTIAYGQQKNKLDTSGQKNKKDSVKAKPKVPIVIDTTKKNIVLDTLKPLIAKPVFSIKADTNDALYKLLVVIPNEPGITTPIKVIPKNKTIQRDYVFYLAVGLIILIGVFRQFNTQYTGNAWQLIFKSKTTQQAANTKVKQAALPSIFLNLLFALVLGAIVFLYAVNKQYAVFNWKIFISIVFVIMLQSLTKYTFIQFLGWLLNDKEAADAYLFRFFMVNKAVAFLLVPFVVIMLINVANTPPLLITMLTFTLTFLYVIRLFISILAWKRASKANWLFYIFFLLFFEFLPFMILYKFITSYVIN
jgi:hypothetical protein